MFCKLEAFTNTLQKEIIPLDLTSPNWSEELTPDLQCFAGKIVFDADTKSVKIESALLSLQVGINDLTLSLIDKTGRYLIFAGWGFRGEMHGVEIKPQDRLYLQLYNGFCGACDFDVDCWDAELVLGGSPTEKKQFSIGIRN